MSSCYNTGLQASRIANDSILSITISSTISESNDSSIVNDAHHRERMIRAVSLLDDIIVRINKPQMQNLQVWNTADATTNLLYVLVARSAGDVKSLRSELESAKAELQKAIDGHPTFSSATISTLRMIEASAQEVVGENNSSLIDID